MAKGSHDTLSRVASCADYDSDEGEEVNGTRKQANIAAKRSGGLAKVDLSAMSSDQLQHPVIPDLQSDSGYSSRTQATAASADSGLSAKIAAAAAATVASAGSEVHTVSSTVSSGTRKTAPAEKKKKKCTDPNCKHRGRSSKTSSTTSPSKPKPRSPPPRQVSPKRRARIDEPESESRQQRPQRPQRPALRPNPASSSQAQAQSRSYHPGMTYPMDPRMAAAYHRAHYPMGPPAHTMYVNRPMPQRPQMQHHASDMSARKINSRAAYGAQPLVVQQAKSNIVHSARAPPKPTKSANARHYEDEDEFEEEPESSSEEETDEEEEEEEDPRAAFIHAQRLKELQELRKRQYEVELHEQRKLQAQQAFQAQQAQAMLAAQRAKEEAARVAMPPPPRPSSAVNTGYSMRRPKNEPSPMITYSDKLGQQINQAFAAGNRPRPTPTGAAKAPSYPVVAPGSRANYAIDEAIRHKRRSSVYGSESIAEIEARERALANSYEELERQREELRRQRRESHGATPGYDAQALRAQLQSLSLGTNDRSATAAGMSKNLDAAQSYIERRRDSSSQPQLTAGILRTHGLDRDITSIRSKRSSREGSSTTGRRRASIIDPEESYDGDGLKMRVDTKQDYEIEIGNHRIELRPNDEGTIDLYVGGKGEHRYHSSKASSAGASKIGRHLSRRTRIIDDESLSEESEEEDEYDTPRERTSVRGGVARRRAETISTTYENEPRRRRDSVKVPASAERPKRGALRRPVFEDELRPQRGEPRRPGTPEEDYYRGPPMYGAAPDEYPRFNQGYNRYEPPSPQPPRGYGSKNQNFQGFGG